MRLRNIYYVAASLDGFIADRRDRLDWLFVFDGAQGVKARYDALLAEVGAIVMGARTYDFLREHGGATWPYPDHMTFVVTRRGRVAWPGAALKFVSGAPSEWLPEVHEVARARGRDAVWIVGGGEVAGQLMEVGALDELQLSVVPVLLGGGTPLLPTATQRALEHVETTPLGMGLVELRYRIVGREADAGGEGARVKGVGES